MNNVLEPQPIGDFVTGALLKGFASPDEQSHPTDGTCKVCKRDLDTQWTKINHRLAPGWFPVTCCDSCMDLINKGNTDQAHANLADWEERCPPEFRRPWDNRIGGEKLHRAVMKFDPANKRGLLVIGPSGTSKTRIVWQLLRRLTLDGVEWHFATALDVMKGLPFDASRKKVLVIDDLGNDPLTMNKEVALLDVIRQRVDWHMPLIVTTQFNGTQLERRFSEAATAQAIVRRLREFCDPVVTSTTTT